MRKGLDNLLVQAETLLIELIKISNPDEIVDDLLKLDVPELAVSICPRESYKYILKRFTNTNHLWFLKRKHNSFYREVFFFIFFNVSIAKSLSDLMHF